MRIQKILINQLDSENKMTKLEDYSRNELKKLAAKYGATEYHNLSKAALIKLINGYVAKQEGKLATSLEAKDAIQVGKNLSTKALQWKTYLERVHITAEVFLQRFPEHNERQYIEELVTKPVVDEPSGESAD